MTRIGRDHGKFRHEVGDLSMDELMWYEANYRYEAEVERKAQEKAKQKGGK